MRVPTAQVKRIARVVELRLGRPIEIVTPRGLAVWRFRSSLVVNFVGAILGAGVFVASLSLHGGHQQLFTQSISAGFIAAVIANVMNLVAKAG